MKAETKANAEIRKAERGERDAIIATLTLAFAVDPPFRWLLPKADDYLALYPGMAAAFGGRAFDAETAFVVENVAAAALWFPPGTVQDDEAIGSMISAAAARTGRRPDRSIGAQHAVFHPSEPHWYLSILGVDPARQGQGLGSALLEHGLALCDRDRTIAYLEASDIRNVPLYERHGFAVRGVITGGDFPPIYPMLRPALAGRGGGR